MLSNKSVFSGRTLVVAFEGWNDAAEAASSAAKFVCEKIQGEVIGGVDPEEYYDFQFTRPTVSFDANGERVLAWPGSDIYAPGAKSLEEHPEYVRISVLIGTEPSRRWRSFTAEILELIEDREIDSVVFLGAMLADVPHTRAIAVTITSQNERARAELQVERSQYEGPVGILSVLGIALEKAGIPAIALWASVPHYVHNTPSPKATLALLEHLESLLGVSFEHGDLPSEAFAWERGIDEIAEADEEMSSYITQLEKTKDEVDSEAASGDALAREFEKFLRSNDDETPETPKQND